MLNLMTSRAGLTASTALVAVGLVAFTPLGKNIYNPDLVVARGFGDFDVESRARVLELGEQPGRD